MNRDPIRRQSRAGLTALFLGLSVAVQAAPPDAKGGVKLPSVFGDHMVLQQKQHNKVWGWADPGEEVTVAIAGQSRTTKADDKGKWFVRLDPMTAGGPHRMTVKGKDRTVTFDDVLVGEVWVCSGQSNMQWDVAAADDADLETLTADYPKIRLLSVPQVGTQEPKDDFRGRWEICTPDTARSFSAVGYFFGRQLHQALGVPVGLIDDSWGGSACEAWVRREVLEKDGRFKPLIERWEKMENDLPGLEAEYEKKEARWKEESEKAKAEGRQPPYPPTKPKDLMAGNSRPGNIYNGVLKPTIGYGIKGVVWYQGESNASRAYQYRELFPLMIKSWRDEWGLGDFSFYWVQLADFLPEKSGPSESAWAELREAQTMTMERLPKTGQAVIIDLGEAQDIHPRNKQDVARRLARWALARDYGVNIPYRSPTYKSFEKKGSKVVVTLDHAGSGLRTFDVGEPRGFTIAGSDRTFVKAKAKLVAGHNDQVEVWSDEVSDPAAVRYAWADNPVCNLYTRDGLPVTPFRTDDWKGVTADAK